MSEHAILQGAEAAICRPWLRHVLPREDWTALARNAVADGWTLLAHWADTHAAHAMYFDPAALAVVPVSVPVEHGRYPALSPVHPGAARYERMVHDLWGHQAELGADPRPWLDHGKWPLAAPLSIRPQHAPEHDPPEPADAPSDPLTLLPLGPLWGDRQEAAQLRLLVDGRFIRQAESRLGYTHKGTLALMRGKSPRAAARFAARLSGDATVAHGLAFALATEAAADVQVPPRATALRVVMAEIERIAGHLDNLAEVAALAGVQTIRTRCGGLRESLVRAAATAFGHRLMMDSVIPGGVAADLTHEGTESILRVLGEISTQLPWLRQAHDGAALFVHLSGIGRASGALAATLGVGGVVGRACGLGFDVRTVFVPGYAALSPRVAVRPNGDAAARQQLRLFEIEESVRLIGGALQSLPDGPTSLPLPQVSGEGIGCAESIRGDVWHWLQLDHGQIAAIFPRDPGWYLWPLAERVLENGTVDDAALIRLSFGLPSSGPDL
ncbi:MAG TPA: nickel-dependent hydrogenase large subunit [Rhodopila sp.]|nr:nickel-dependent hydrogenase large subunit [Rhodopila sp.]